MTNTVRCAHGYGLLQDSCPGCDAAEDTPHPADPVTVTPSWSTRPHKRCRQCGLRPSASIHRTTT